MPKTVSFTSLENRYMREIRSRISTSEDRVDLTNQFSLISAELMSEALGGVAVRIDDVSFDAGTGEHYRVSERLRSMPGFADAWNGSDLPVILGRFAGVAWKHYQRLVRHPSRTELKFRIS